MAFEPEVSVTASLLQTVETIAAASGSKAIFPAVPTLESIGDRLNAYGPVADALRERQGNIVTVERLTKGLHDLDSKQAKAWKGVRDALARAFAKQLGVDSTDMKAVRACISVKVGTVDGDPAVIVTRLS